jgi:hypothetical protein
MAEVTKAYRAMRFKADMDMQGSPRMLRDPNGDWVSFAAYERDIAAAREQGIPPKVRHISEYHEDYGNVLWWDSDVCDSHEPPYIGIPSSSDFNRDPEWCTPYLWWSPLPDLGPLVAAAEAARPTT